MLMSEKYLLVKDIHKTTKGMVAKGSQSQSLFEVSSTVSNVSNVVF